MVYNMSDVAREWEWPEDGRADAWRDGALSGVVRQLAELADSGADPAKRHSRVRQLQTELGRVAPLFRYAPAGGCDVESVPALGGGA